jgi:hypothetical protein
LIEFVEAVLQASQRCEVGSLDRPKGGVFSGQLAVGSDQRNSHGATESAED